MKKTVGVRFKKSGKIYNFDPMDLDINISDDVIVETARGIEFGRVVTDRTVDTKEKDKELKPVLRIADDLDKEINRENKKKAKDAFDICKIKIKEHDLDMNLIESEYTFDNSRLIFYFSADDRVDFRELVKNLAQIFKTRIELRQIGVRDEVKHFGAMGVCGQECCCSRFLGDFNPVSIKMAKEQNLSLNPSKISGICGRLLCCLDYEYEGYQKSRKEMPEIGNRVETPDGIGEVLDINLISRTVEVNIETEDGTFEKKKYNNDEIKQMRNCNNCNKFEKINKSK